MSNDLNKKLNEVLSGIDKNKILKSKKTIEEFASTPDGQKLLNELKNTDKNKLLEMFMKMDTSEIKRKLQNADVSKLSNMNLGDIKNKLK